VNQTRFRQIARLEQLAKPYLEEVGSQIDKEWWLNLQGAAAHAAILAFLIRYGNPKIGEPLSLACQRVSESSAWREVVDKFPVQWFAQSDRSFRPYSSEDAFVIGIQLRHLVISRFHGTNEKDKLNAVFASAPPWLIWFTFADYTAELLNLTLPDLSSVTGFTRSEANFDLWIGLPRGAFELVAWPNGPKKERLARTDLDLMFPPTRWLDDQMTPRERKRAIAIYFKSQSIKHTYDWPSLLSAKSLWAES
jgi:hypothetical protein